MGSLSAQAQACMNCHLFMLLWASHRSHRRALLSFWVRVRFSQTQDDQIWFWGSLKRLKSYSRQTPFNSRGKGICHFSMSGCGKWWVLGMLEGYCSHPSYMLSETPVVPRWTLWPGAASISFDTKINVGFSGALQYKNQYTFNTHNI